MCCRISLLLALLGLMILQSASSYSTSSSSFSLRRRQERMGSPHETLPEQGSRRRGAGPAITDSTLSDPSSSSQRGQRVRRRLRQRRRSRRRIVVTCHEEGSDDNVNSSPPTTANATTANAASNSTPSGWTFNSIGHALRDPSVTNNSSATETAADRFADAEGTFVSGQSVGNDDDDETPSSSAHPSASPTTASETPSTLAPTPVSSPSCPTNPPASQQVICQGGTVTFPSLCLAKQALGDALTDCLLVDTSPVTSETNVGADSSSTPVVATATESATVTESAQVPLTLEDCPERDDDQVDDDDNGQGPLIVCNGDMVFASWCDAFRHHFTRQECEEY